jgi:hypothetical protein
MMSLFEQMNEYELVSIRSTLLRGVVETRYTTAKEREAWQAQVDAITAELTRRNELKL